MKLRLTIWDFLDLRVTKNFWSWLYSIQGPKENRGTRRAWYFNHFITRLFHHHRCLVCPSVQWEEKKSHLYLNLVKQLFQIILETEFQTKTCRWVFAVWGKQYQRQYRHVLLLSHSNMEILLHVKSWYHVDRNGIRTEPLFSNLIRSKVWKLKQFSPRRNQCQN